MTNSNGKKLEDIFTLYKNIDDFSNVKDDVCKIYELSHVKSFPFEVEILPLNEVNQKASKYNIGKIGLAGGFCTENYPKSIIVPQGQRYTIINIIIHESSHLTLDSKAIHKGEENDEIRAFREELFAYETLFDSLEFPTYASELKVLKAMNMITGDFFKDIAPFTNGHPVHQRALAKLEQQYRSR